MKTSKLEIANQKLNSLPAHLVDEAIKYLDFLQFKSIQENDLFLEEALNKAIIEGKEGKTTLHSEVISGYRDKFSK